jgi:hypothetical protein
VFLRLGEVIPIEDCAERMQKARHFYFLTLDGNEGIDASRRVRFFPSIILTILVTILLLFGFRETLRAISIIAVSPTVRHRSGGSKEKLALAFSPQKTFQRFDLILHPKALTFKTPALPTKLQYT